MVIKWPRTPSIITLKFLNQNAEIARVFTDQGAILQEVRDRQSHLKVGRVTIKREETATTAWAIVKLFLSVI